MAQALLTEPSPESAELAASARAAETAGDYDRALGTFRGLMELEPDSPRWTFGAIRVLRKSGRADEAAEALREALVKWPAALERPEIRALVPNVKPDDERTLRSLGDDIPSEAQLARPTVEDDGKSDFIVGEGRRKIAVLVFTGLADRMVMPLPMFDRYLAELDVTGIYLRDARRIGFFNGVRSLAPDYDATIAALRDLLAEKGVEEVHTIGNSAGGMAAVSYGIDLGAKTVLGFSAPVALTRAAADRDRRTGRFADRIVGQVPEERRNLRARLEQAPDTSVRLFYGAAMPEDRYHAETLEGLPNVQLEPIEGMAGHGALFRVAHTGRLRKLLHETYGAA